MFGRETDTFDSRDKTEEWVLSVFGGVSSKQLRPGGDRFGVAGRF